MNSVDVPTSREEETMVFETREHKINYLKKQNREHEEEIKHRMRKVFENQAEIERLIREVEESGAYRKKALNFSSKKDPDDKEAGES